MSAAISRFRQAIDVDAVQFAARINVFGVGRAVIVQPIAGRAAGLRPGMANIAPSGAGALVGIFMPVVDVMDAIPPQGPRQTLFGLAASSR